MITIDMQILKQTKIEKGEGIWWVVKQKEKDIPARWFLTNVGQILAEGKEVIWERDAEGREQGEHSADSSSGGTGKRGTRGLGQAQIKVWPHILVFRKFKDYPPEPSLSPCRVCGVSLLFQMFFY